jgi:SAC3/GANP family
MKPVLPAAAAPAAAANVSSQGLNTKKCNLKDAQAVTGEVHGLASASCIALSLKLPHPRMLEHAVHHRADFLTRKEWAPEQLVVAEYRRSTPSYNITDPQELRDAEWLRMSELFLELYCMCMFWMPGAVTNDPRCNQLLQRHPLWTPDTHGARLAALVCDYVAGVQRQIAAEYRVQGYNPDVERVAAVADMNTMEHISRYLLFMWHRLADNPFHSTDRPLLKQQLMNQLIDVMNMYAVARKREEQSDNTTTTTAATDGAATGGAATGRSANEAEIRAYYLLLLLHTTSAATVADSMRQLTDRYPDLLQSPWMQLAATVIAAVQENDYKSFFAAFEQAPLLIRVTMFELVQGLREHALLELSRSVREISLSPHLQQDLGFYYADDALHYCSEHGLYFYYRGKELTVVFKFDCVRYGERELLVMPRDAVGNDRIKPFELFLKATDGRRLCAVSVSYTALTFDIFTNTL